MNIGAKCELTKAISPSSRIFAVLALSTNLGIVIAMPATCLLARYSKSTQIWTNASGQLTLAIQSLASAMFIYERERVDDGAPPCPIDNFTMKVGTFMTDYSNAKPEDVWLKIRSGEITGQTSGMCNGYAQANLVIMPEKYAADFEEFAHKNPKPCPLLEVIHGSKFVKDMGEGANILTDIPKYRIFENGVLVKEVTDATPYWQDDMAVFLIGCSFSFEEALMKAGIDVRHISMGRNVPMFRTKVMTEPAGPFSGELVVSMRPMTPEDAKRADEITGRFPNVHGAPVNIGEPEKLGITDLMKPDYGDPVEIKPGEIPVFWGCGVTPQSVIEHAKLPLVITHAPGHMFITNMKNDAVNDFLEAKKHK